MRRFLSLQTFATNLVILSFGLANSVMLSRWLHVSGRGEVAAVMLWPLLVGFLASTGLIPATVYFTAKPGSRPGVVFGNAMAMAVVQSAIALPLAYLAMPMLLAFQRPEVVRTCQLYLLVVPLTLVTQYSCGFLQGKVMMMPVNGMRLIIPVGYMVGVWLFHLFGTLTVDSVVRLHLGLNLACMVLSLVAVRLSGAASETGLDVGLAREMIRYGLKVHVGSISQGLNMRLDQVVLAAWAPPAQLGLYVAAVSAAGVTQTLSHAYRLVVMPSLAGQAKESGLLARVEGVFRGYWLLSLAFAGPVGLGLFWAIPLVYGSEFRGAIWPAEVLVIGTLLLGAKEVLSGVAQALGDPLLESKAELAAFVVTLASLPVLLPWLGILGAAVASVLAYGTSLAVVVLGLHRSTAVSPALLFRIDRLLITDFMRLLRGEAA